MTHKDYIKIAGAIATARRRAIEDPRLDGVDDVIDELIRVLKDDNPRFDADRFYFAAIGAPLTARDRP